MVDEIQAGPSAWRLRTGLSEVGGVRGIMKHEAVLRAADGAATQKLVDGAIHSDREIGTPSGPPLNVESHGSGEPT